MVTHTLSGQRLANNKTHLASAVALWTIITVFGPSQILHVALLSDFPVYFLL